MTASPLAGSVLFPDAVHAGVMQERVTRAESEGRAPLVLGVIVGPRRTRRNRG
jgi:hypothetical protein